MTSNRFNPADPELDAIFAESMSQAPEPRTELLNAVLADAAEVATQRSRARQTPKDAARQANGFFRSLFNNLGGWPAATALACCGVVGFVAGIYGAGDVAQSLVWGDALAVDYSADTIVSFLDTALAGD